MSVVKDFRIKVVLQNITEHTIEKGHINVIYVTKHFHRKEVLQYITKYTLAKNLINV